MQFEMTSTFLSCTTINVDNRSYCSVFTGQTPAGDAASNTLGLEVTKITAEPDVFLQLKAQGFAVGDSVRFLATLKKAANGKSQPHIIGVVPGQKPEKTRAVGSQ